MFGSVALIGRARDSKSLGCRFEPYLTRQFSSKKVYTMSSIQKYVNALFLFAASIVWLIVNHYTSVVVGYFQLGRTLGSGVDFLEHGIPLLLAFLTFIILRRNSNTHRFANDAIGELVRVHWPTQKDVTLGTVVVIVTVLAAGVVLGFLDMGLVGLVRTLIGA
jgi:preprotein translocase SecE subunit